MSVRVFVSGCQGPILALSSQYITNKSCLACAKSKKYEKLVILRPIRQCKAKIRKLKITSVFYHLPNVGSKQLYTLDHQGYIREVDIYYIPITTNMYKENLMSANFFFV